MTDPEIRRLEIEVEAARKKLGSDLSRLKAPTAHAEFNQGVKQSAGQIKDAVLGEVKSSARSALQGLVEELKGKAAANPAATLAIGTGVAWQLFRHPPIATALVGAGLFSLWRTEAESVPNNDYLGHATENLGRQAANLAEEVKKRTANLAGDIKDQALSMAESVSDQSSEVLDGARDKVQHWGENLGEIAHEVSERTALVTQDSRNTLLLGTAGVAVIAALGFAYNRRLAEHAEE